MDDTASEIATVLISAHDVEIKSNAESAETQNSVNFNESTKSENNSKKDSSLDEDLLGANSLLMSDSEDENDNASSNIKDTNKTPENTNVDFKINDELKPTKNEVGNKSSEEEININSYQIVEDKVVLKNNKTSAIIDSDTEEENLEPQIPEEIEVSTKKSAILDSDTDDEKVNVQSSIKIKARTKISAILDSDTDEEYSGEKLKVQSTSEDNAKTKFSALIDTDSETDNENNSTNANKLEIFNFDEEDSDSQKSKIRKKSRKLKKKKDKKQKVAKKPFTDSESETGTNTNESDAHESINNEELEDLSQLDAGATDEHSERGKSKPIRASAKKALEEMQAIQSEQQRLHREAHISIPYHKPKRHTLQEFLKRRTIIKPASDNKCSTAATILSKKNLKMSAEELEEYAQLMEERAKEAKEFFKSESESEDGELRDNEGVMNTERPCNEEKGEANNPMETDEMEIECNDKCETEAEATPPALQILDEINIEKTTSVLNEPINNLKLETVMDFDSLEANKQPTIECSTQPIVTEVLELPRLDLSALHVTEEIHDNIATSSYLHLTQPDKVEDQKTKILNELQATESPRIKGDVNMLIDLESGDLITKNSTGADSLLQRLLATNKIKKGKPSETVSVLSTENGKFEMTKLNFHHQDELEVKKEQKPGAAYLKLKENLKMLIKKKRLEEMQKKQEDEDEYKKCLEGENDDEDDYELNEDEEYEIEEDIKVKKQKQKPKYDEIVIDDEENAILSNDDGDDRADEDDDESLEDEENKTTTEVIKNEGVEKGETDDESANDSEVEAVQIESDSDDSNDDNNDLVDNEHKFKEPITTTQRKNRIIKAFANDSDVEDDDMDLLKTQLPITESNVETPLFGVLVSPSKSRLSLGTSSTADDIGNTQELLELCSGTFETTQKPAGATTTSTDTVLISQIPLTLRNPETDMAAELMTLCSGTFQEHQEAQQTQQTQQTQLITPVVVATDMEEESSKPKFYKILSSDEEEKTASISNQTQNRIKKLRKKLRKGKAKLGFSDDEDEFDELDFEETEAEAEADDDNDDDDHDVVVDMPETYVEYDSEENEVIVEMTKKDRRLRAENFLEHEAELSESEWGSADEDEKNMDKYDIELGDEDEFDREKLQQELGQIHARKVLDEDIREVRKLQEMLFEDEENDGVGRQRQFRWKNVENGFSLDDMQRVVDGGADGAESGEEEQKQEHEWRKIRYEREQLLKEQGIKESSQEFLTTTLGSNSPLATLLTNINNFAKSSTPNGNSKKIQVINKKTTTTTTAAKQNGSPFLISTTKKVLSTMVTNLKPQILTKSKPTTPSILQPKEARASFLMRDKESLTKFANITKGIAASSHLEDDETAGTVSVKTVKAKNFVFATLTKEEHEHMKRKADDLINSSSENGINFMKKPRYTGPTDKQCFIDKLL